MRNHCLAKAFGRGPFDLLEICPRLVARSHRWCVGAPLIGCLVALSACNTAQLYEGGGDYRYIGALKGVQQGERPPPAAAVSPSESTTGSPVESTVASSSSPREIRAVRGGEKESLNSTEWFADWMDKYQSQLSRGKMTDKFQKGDTISIYLKSAMFSYITEGSFKRTIAEHFRKSGKVAGQIAIIANVSADQSLAPLVSPAEASNPGRVIFYSGDVEEGQMINQSFGPVYGPIRWDGGPIMLDVTVVEIDEEERKQTGAVISSLAKLGTAPGINASPVSLALLNTLGSALVQSNRDDVMGRFRLLLTPDIQSSTYLPTLREGDLVLIRKSKRDFGYPWRDDCSHVPPHRRTRGDSAIAECDWYSSYNPGTGQFSPRNDESNKTNYMVFTFVRNMTGPDLTPTTTTAQLLEKIKASGPNELAGSIDELVTVKKKEAAGKDLRERLSRLSDIGTTALYRRHIAQDIALTAQCILLKSAADAQGDATLKPAQAATEKYCRTKETYNTTFVLADFDMLMRRMGEICERTTGGKPVTDVSTAFSRNVLVGTAPVDFSTLETVMRPKSETAAAKVAECGVAL